ncbi:MAG: hypothetical protein IJT97_10455, partial [Bacteroidaceae bacterium]|nr:hypothetical protein [Bacteroidaceae bacterium]
MFDKIHCTTLITALLLLFTVSCTDEEQAGTATPAEGQPFALAIVEQPWQTEVTNFTRSGETLEGLMKNTSYEWDFSKKIPADSAKMRIADTEWRYNAEKKRYDNLMAIGTATEASPVTAGGVELLLMKGLTITNAAGVSGSSEGKLKIDYGKQLQLGGSNITLTLPS